MSGWELLVGLRSSVHWVSLTDYLGSRFWDHLHIYFWLSFEFLCGSIHHLEWYFHIFFLEADVVSKVYNILTQKRNVHFIRFGIF